MTPGDSILFERGSYFFGTILIYNSGTESNPIYFGAFGNGPKPVFIAAEQIRDSVQNWQPSGTRTNVYFYKDKHTDVDVANLVLEDHNGQISFGKKLMLSSFFVPDVNYQGEFWYDRFAHRFEFYSIGSPQSKYRSIQLVKSVNAIELNQNNYLIFENLDFRYYGRCVLETGGTNCTFKNLDISYIGGADQDGNSRVRFGNGLQIWLGEHDVSITGCRFDNVYDAAISPQGSTSTGADTVYNIFMRNNVITNCEYSFEFFEWGEGDLPLLYDIYFENNTCVNAGGGWSHNQRHGILSRKYNIYGPDPNGSHVRLERIEGKSSNIFIRYNIFYGATERLYWIIYPDSIGHGIVSDYNVFFQPAKIPVGTINNFEGDPAINFKTLRAWKDTTKFEANSFYSDPMFFSSTDFHLSPCSPVLARSFELEYGKYYGAYPPAFLPDREPPVIRQLNAEPSTLWPADHSMKEVAIYYTAKDNCELVSTSLDVSSNEPVSGLSRRDLSPDWIILDDHHIKLRAERSAQGNGRTYTIKIKAKDAVGNVTTRRRYVYVPKNLNSLNTNESVQFSGIEELNEVGILDCKVFPNPSSQYFVIEIMSPSNESIDLSLTDLTGRPIISLKGQKEKTIKLGHNLQRGIYFAEIRQGDQFKKFKLVKL